MRIKNLFKISSFTPSLKVENNCLFFFKLIGLLHSVALMFGNEMLFCSWFFSSLLSSLLLVLLLDGVLNHLPSLLRVPTQVCSGLLFLFLPLSSLGFVLGFALFMSYSCFCTFILFMPFVIVVVTVTVTFYCY